MRNTEPQKRYTDLYEQLLRCTDKEERQRLRNCLANALELMYVDPAVGVNVGDYRSPDYRMR